MSIKVENVSKFYNTQKALNEISFEICKGEIVGFLGPNGAGKSTMMKILTGFIPQSQGSVQICGLDVCEENLKAKNKIGYLPEHNPLYLDMYVREYLGFIVNLYKADPCRIDEMIQKTGLKNEQHKLIRSLSKGYRQRVGLAQALLNNPEVLILDEPTTGLDPNQLVEIRSLIKEMGADKTVLLSTHIMQEVEAICDRVIIINKGVIVANKTIEELRKSKDGKNIITILFNEKVFKNELQAIENVEEVDEIGTNEFKITSDACHDLRKQLFEFAVAKKFTVLQMSLEENKLEDIFHKLTN
ncbi:gliding motility-associated ABC transporter ATP-binding subunit GldA [Flavobacteriales bacterium]|nr:gliding motility-associated ABC transporter ATP-binding subunit GldA [Flavobacteriales bacterium]MDG1145120.1 gliding motility-associated ABC transporter ATP-binding subunit GldA [Flavobacteriales bacterium]MDG1395988.1 gliding motility-associated ABC transporter ATP-binding subunit GldA [Flavobacteriales bacterium]